MEVGEGFSAADWRCEVFIIANAGWPLLFETAADQRIFWLSVVIGLLVEWPIIVRITGRTWNRSLIPTIVVNLCSAIAGVLPLKSALHFQLVNSIESGEPFTEWLSIGILSVMVGVVALNVVIEGLVLFKLYNARMGMKSLLQFFAANCISTAISIVGSILTFASTRS